jgi:hypothetical protein
VFATFTSLKMHPQIIEALPSLANGALAVALQISFAIVANHVIFAGVQQKGRLVRERVDLVDRLLERDRHVLIWRPVERNVAVADLGEAKVATWYARARHGSTAGAHATAERPDQSSPGPGHTREKSAPVDPVGVLMVVLIRHDLPPRGAI